MSLFRFCNTTLIAGSLLSIASLFSTTASAETAPETIYKERCAGCHVSGFFGAPTMGDAFKERLTRAGSIDALVQTTAQGVGRMPPQGGPKGRTDAELRATIEWMLKQY